MSLMRGAGLVRSEVFAAAEAAVAGPFVGVDVVVEEGGAGLPGVGEVGEVDVFDAGVAVGLVEEGFDGLPFGGVAGAVVDGEVLAAFVEGEADVVVAGDGGVGLGALLAEGGGFGGQGGGERGE